MESNPPMQVKSSRNAQDVEGIPRKGPRAATAEEREAIRISFWNLRIGVHTIATRTGLQIRAVEDVVRATPPRLVVVRKIAA